jgi:hypothetical protein
LHVNHVVVSATFRSTDAQLFSMASHRECSPIHYADVLRLHEVEVDNTSRERYIEGAEFQAQVHCYINNL